MIICWSDFSTNSRSVAKKKQNAQNYASFSINHDSTVVTFPKIERLGASNRSFDERKLQAQAGAAPDFARFYKSALTKSYLGEIKK